MASRRIKERSRSVVDQLEVGDLLIRPFYCTEHKCRAVTLPNPEAPESYIHLCSGGGESIQDLLNAYEFSMPARAHFIAESPNMVRMIIAQARHQYMKYFAHNREKGLNGEEPDSRTYLPFLNFYSIPMDEQSWMSIMSALRSLEDEGGYDDGGVR